MRVPLVIFTSTNLGVTSKSNSMPSDAWFSIASSADGSMLIAPGDHGLIYTSTNLGANWRSNNFPFVRVSDSWPVTSSAGGSKPALVINGGEIYVAQTFPQPQLTISGSGANAKISWTVPSTNLVLLQSSNLQHWANTANTPPINLTNLHNEVAIPPST